LLWRINMGELFMKSSKAWKIAREWGMWRG